MSIESASATSDCQHIDNAQTKDNIPITIDRIPVNALVNIGSTLSHISEKLSRHLNLRLEGTIYNVGLAVWGCSSKSLGLCKANIEVKGDAYSNVTFTVLKDWVSDVILGRDFMNLHQSVNIHFGEEKPTLYLGELRIVETPTTVSLFKPLSNDCRPIATKFRYCSITDQSFISSEIQRLLKEDLIERSSSPLRAKPLVVTHENHKKRMVIDCSQTINTFNATRCLPIAAHARCREQRRPIQSFFDTWPQLRIPPSRTSRSWSTVHCFLSKRCLVAMETSTVWLDESYPLFPKNPWSNH